MQEPVWEINTWICCIVLGVGVGVGDNVGGGGGRWGVIVNVALQPWSPKVLTWIFIPISARCSSHLRL